MFISLSVLFGIFIFCFGAIIGSFLNVVILRINTGRLPTGRSRCMSCGKTLGVLDLIPILSYLSILGKCRKCGSHVSVQYPLVELLTAAVFTLLYWQFESTLITLSLLPLIIFLVSLVVASILIVISVYDLRHKIIPNAFVYSFIAVGFCIALSRYVLVRSISSPLSYLDLFAGPILFLFFYSLWRFSEGKWMGLGDGKLALGIGFILGFEGGLSAIILGFWIGAAFGILLLALNAVLPALSLKKGGNAITMRSEIPFAPFLVIGMALVFFFNIHVLLLF